MEIQLVYETTCPNKETTKRLIENILLTHGILTDIIEIDKDDPNAPNFAKNLSSPTILIDGKDIEEGAEGSGGNSCRLYKNESGKLSGTPPRHLLENAILEANRKIL